MKAKPNILSTKDAVKLMQSLGYAISERTMRKWCQLKKVKAKKIRLNKFTEEWQIPASEIANLLKIRRDYE